MSLLLLLLLPAAPTRHSKAERRLQTDAPAADAPLFVLKQERTGSSWLHWHLDNLKMYASADMEVTNYAQEKAQDKYGHGRDGWTKKDYRVFSRDAAGDVLDMLKGHDGKYGAAGTNPFKILMELTSDGNVTWGQVPEPKGHGGMYEIMNAVKEAIDAGEMPPPKILVLTRRNVVHQALSEAKAEDMEKHHACKFPYTEESFTCVKRFTYKWAQDPADLVELTLDLNRKAKALPVLAGDLMRAWGSTEVTHVYFEELLEQGEGNGLAMPFGITGLIGSPNEDGESAKLDPYNANATVRGMPPHEFLKNFQTVFDYFEKEGYHKWAKQLAADGHSSSRWA